MRSVRRRWVEGAWDLHADGGAPAQALPERRCRLPAVAGQNAWATTPECPQGGPVIGVPNGYEYNAGADARTNAARRWYLQIKGVWAKAFRLESIRVEYRLRTARGGA